MTKTVYVIGAGASQEAGLPTGEELKNHISALLNLKFAGHRDGRQSGDPLVVDALKEFIKTVPAGTVDIRELHNCCRNISAGLSTSISIDNFLDNHRGEESLALCGKIGIVRAILLAERSSKLYSENPQSTIEFSGLEESWYLQFFQLLTENCHVDDLEDRFREVTLIIFNYDRCVERYLYFALINTYMITSIRAQELLDFIKIYHPYGMIGVGDFDGIEFGGDPSPKQLLLLSSSIKTFTESIDSDACDLKNLKLQVAQAKRLVFLGFAFHQRNIELIQPDQSQTSDRSMIDLYATGYEISNPDCNVIEKNIKEAFGPGINVNISSQCCYPFFKEFRRSLSF
ncbi:hypothetical protein N9J88_02450 [Porticoccaceae bacterium]|nr:hypothetical protein [Porticoccaceae bacterium]